MAFNKQLAASDPIRYLAFFGLHPAGTTAQYFQWLSDTGRLSDEERDVRDTIARLPALGRQIDQGEAAYQRAIDAGRGDDPRVADLRAKLDEAEARFSDFNHQVHYALDLAQQQLGLNLGELGDWADVGAVVTGIALVAAAVVLLIFVGIPAGVAGLLVAGCAAVLVASGSVLTLLGLVGPLFGQAAKKAAGVGLLAALAVGLFVLAAPVRRRA